ncbi:biosynthetic peptidoglycan transglycosylase [Morganella morganii]|mgnify:CR=1 FL=1|uniref:biosynthetic peptidoglycan transglycosylase n=1 Tax=Morganella morganii TaxID=582 RepID=UPI003F228800
MSLDEPMNNRSKRRLRNILISLNVDLIMIENQIYHNDMIKLTNLHYYIVCLEDRRFFSHRGVDFRSVLRECFKALTFKKHGGASTIDMQMVRTITGFKENTMFRKIYESILAFIINYRYTKKQIIDCYVRTAFFGSRLYGAEAAAKNFYSKKIEKLNNDEMAFIASMLLRPKPLNPTEKWLSNTTLRSRYAQGIFRKIKDRFK